MATYFQCILIETGPGEFSVILPRDLRVEQSESGPEPLPENLRDKDYFTVQAKPGSFDSFIAFKEALLELVDRETSAGAGQKLKQLGSHIAADDRFGHGEIMNTKPEVEPEIDENDEIEMIIERGSSKAKQEGKKERRYKKKYH